MHRAQRALPALLGLVALAVEVPRLYPTVAAVGDSPELVTAAAVLGVPHPPGYPLYVWLGHLAVGLVGANPAWTLHLLSAVLHAAVVMLVADGIARLCGSLIAAASGAVTLLLSRSFLLGSLYAEVFPLNDFFFAALLVLALRIARATDPTRRSLLVFAALAGFSFSHHQMIALAGPALALLVGGPFVRAVRARPSFAVALVLVFVTPIVLCYGLVPLAAARDPIISWGEVHDLRSLLQLLTRADYGGLLHASRRAAEGQLLDRLDVFWATLGRSFGALGLLWAAGGAVSILGRDRKIGAALLLGFVVAGPVFAGLNAVDIHSETRAAFFERFTTMCHIPLAWMVGAGVAELERRLLSYRWRLPAGAMLAAAPALPLLGHLRFDFHEDRLGEAYGHDLIRVTENGSLVLLTGDMPSHLALYVCGVERACGDRIVLSPLQSHLAWKMAQIAKRYPDLARPLDRTGSLDVAAMVERELGRRPVYVHPELLQKRPELASKLAFAPGLLLLRARQQGEVLVPTAFPSCEACSLKVPPLWHPSMEASVLSTYADGLQSLALVPGAPSDVAQFQFPRWNGP